MALDILSIPAILAKLKRLFSGAKITITDCRNRLGIESIKAIVIAGELEGSWLAGGQQEGLQYSGGSA
jgi:hAT family C-terminal dimerisation region